MEDTKMGFWMPFAKAREGAGYGFRSDQAKVVQIVGPSGVRIVGVDDATGERCAILRDSVKVVLIGARIEFRDQSAVLLDRGLDNENIDAALKRGANHFAPLGFAALAARGAVTIAGQKVRAVPFLEGMLDFLRAEKRPVLRILDAV